MQGEEGGKSRRRAGGTKAQSGEANSKEAKRGNGPLACTLAGKSPFPGSSALQGNWKLQGRAAAFLPTSTRAGRGWVFFFLAIKVWPLLVLPREDENPAWLYPPSPGQSTECHRAEAIRERFSQLEQRLLWETETPARMECFRGLRGRAAHTPGPSGLRSEPSKQEHFRRDKKYRQDGQREGSLPHSSASVPECAMPLAGRGEKKKIKEKEKKKE